MCAGNPGEKEKKGLTRGPPGRDGVDRAEILVVERGEPESSINNSQLNTLVSVIYCLFAAIRYKCMYASAYIELLESLPLLSVENMKDLMLITRNASTAV